MQLLAKNHSGVQMAAITAPEPPNKRAREKTLYDQVRDERRAHIQALGQKAKITSVQFHKAVQDRMLGIRASPESLALYDDGRVVGALVGPVGGQAPAAAPASTVARPEPRPMLCDIGAGGAGSVQPFAPPQDLTGILSVYNPSRVELKQVPLKGPCYPVSVAALSSHLPRPTIEGMLAGDSYAAIQQRFTRAHNDYAIPSPNNGGTAGRKPRFRATPAGRTRERNLLEKSLREFVVEATKPVRVGLLSRAKLLFKVVVEHVFCRKHVLFQSSFWKRASWARTVQSQFDRVYTNTSSRW